jgi:two-component system response regulator YesN
MPTRQFLSPVIDTRSFLMIGALVLIIIGAGMSMLLSRNFYRPIRRLLDQIKPHLTNQPEETGNELQYIQDTWLRTRLQNESLHKQMEHQLGYVRDQFLYQLIRGSNPDYEDWNTTHPDQSLQLEGERFFVALVLPDISADRPLHSGEIERMTQLFSHIAIPDLLDAYGLELVERFTFAFIACVTDTILPAKEVQRLMAIEIHDCLQGQVGLKAIVGFGHSYPRLDMINRSYIEAAAAADYRMMTGNDGFIFFEDIGQVEHRHLWLPAAVQLRFVQSLKQGDRGMARQMLHAMIESIRTDVKSYLMSKLVCVDLINSAAKVIHELQIEDRSGLIKKSAEFKQLDELESTIGEMITLICDHVQTMQEQRQYRLSTDILEAVKEQFRSPGMSLDYLAERFQLSTSYISRFLKEHSGILFSEYLFQLRYEEAKRMLVETDRTVKEIVNSVGYVGESKFIERFKKKEGVTPGQYRKIHAEKSKAESERKV